MDLARGYFGRRLGAIQTALDEAADFNAASRSLVELAASWTPDALATILNDGLELAAWSGREAVFLDSEDTLFAGPAERLVFREQIDFLRQKRAFPTKHWTDALKGDHDRGFAIAGVTNIAMLEDVQAAIIKAAETGGNIERFSKDFLQIAGRYGWSYDGDMNWRIRTILETNMRTSFMAGRLRQMRDPDVVKLRPYWQYLHADSRIPLMPRVDHVSWDGLVLMWDDPWWNAHFPPNDWRCSCGVRTLSKRDLGRLGKTGPDEAPKDVLLPVIDRTTKQMIMRPRGIGFGWDYTPGDLWERGLVPSALIDEAGGTDKALRQRVSIDMPEPIADLLAKARKPAANLLQPGLSPEDYASAFLSSFGATMQKAVMFTDAAGMRIPISAEMFRHPDGKMKSNKRNRGIYMMLLAEAIRDPDEIWTGLVERPYPADKDSLQYVLDRRYIRVNPDAGLFAVFEMGRVWWQEITTYPTTNAKGDVSYSVLDARRGGKLVWKRK